MISHGAISESLIESVKVLHRILVPVYLTLPTKEEAKREAELFSEYGEMIPNVFMRLVEVD